MYVTTTPAIGMIPQDMANKKLGWENRSDIGLTLLFLTDALRYNLNGTNLIHLIC